MKAPRKTVAAAVAALAIGGSFAMTSLAVGATTSHHHATPVTRTVANTTKKPVTITYKFNGSYSGTISILWNASGKTTASVTGKGAGALYGLTKLSGNGSVTASGQSDPINGIGVASGKGFTLTLEFITGSTATAASTTPPTVVTISGNAKIIKGTGKFKGATGTLKVSGEFSIQSTSGHEKDAYTATLKGSAKVKS